MTSDQPEVKKIESDVENVIDKGRIVGFSDAVFAFAATLLILKIDLPQSTRLQIATQLPQALAQLWPQYLANIITFLVIGYYWLNHHAIFGLMKKFNATIVWINILFLICVSFLPFPVDLYGDFPAVPIVVVFYTASLALVGYLLSMIWWYASYKHRLINEKMSDKRVWYYFLRSLIAPVVFTISIPLVYIHPTIAQLSWLLVIAGIVLLNRYFKFGKVSEIERVSTQ